MQKNLSSSRWSLHFSDSRSLVTSTSVWSLRADLCWCSWVWAWHSEASQVKQVLMATDGFSMQWSQGEEYLTLWTEERSLSGRICFPDSMDTGEAEVMSTLERYRFCEKILADGTLQGFANSPHGAAFTCYGRLLCPALLILQLINVLQVYKPLKSLIVSGY
ncbi:hypothetical protein GOODEAATRI_001608 [Goodea atripinnis]|uniref:Uncharacterized protein n=1 Tax=Goodea atripinnis TaxID=208336 RepID=A0ABV0NR15_9TELE